MAESLITQIADTADILKRFLGERHPVCALVLGSGLNFYADTLEDRSVLPYKDVPHMKVSTAVGHKGQFVLGKVPRTEVWVICMQGRLHGYEGVTAQDVALPVWALHEAGIDTLVTTNAAGALNPAFKVGSFCAMTDHINMTGRNPVAHTEANQIAERFVPMLDAYDPHLRALLLDVAAAEQVDVNEGVYLGLLGPSFETPAEIRVFSQWADTVAMSVVEEVIAARHVGMRVVGLSLVSNMGCGIEGASPNSDEVMDVAETVKPAFKALMDGFIVRIAEAPVAE
ncbi:purine-nucleoside phosphorylase [Anaerotardibacter muris]|uniref:purine-nucleoside phosphorylase n=1 Tax=Anaerotardibacter muris TaxID=2941505 RepID=UPI00203AE87B|nr:purine-nucleoside phosphorylase [Anaerotardibacter muris]